jgi:hypothetical protein
MAFIYLPEDWKSPSKTRNLKGRLAISLLRRDASSKAPHMMPFSIKTVPNKNQVCQAGYRKVHTYRYRQLVILVYKLMEVRLHFEVG